MTFPRISQSILAELRVAATLANPALSTARGDLFIASESGMGAIRLKVSLADYLQFIHQLDASIRPGALWIAPQKNEQWFQVAVLVPLGIANGQVVANGRSVTLL